MTHNIIREAVDSLMTDFWDLQSSLDLTPILNQSSPRHLQLQIIYRQESKDDALVSSTRNLQTQDSKIHALALALTEIAISADRRDLDDLGAELAIVDLGTRQGSLHPFMCPWTAIFVLKPKDGQKVALKVARKHTRANDKSAGTPSTASVHPFFRWYFVH